MPPKFLPELFLYIMDTPDSFLRLHSGDELHRGGRGGVFLYIMDTPDSLLRLHSGDELHRGGRGGGGG